jgi:hypothetical protein
MAIWSILLPFGLFCGNFVNIMVIWYIFSRFGLSCLEKSGNPFVAKNAGKGITVLGKEK